MIRWRARRLRAAVLASAVLLAAPPLAAAREQVAPEPAAGEVRSDPADPAGRTDPVGQSGRDPADQTAWDPDGAAGPRGAADPAGEAAWDPAGSAASGSAGAVAWDPAGPSALDPAAPAPAAATGTVPAARRDVFALPAIERAWAGRAQGLEARVARVRATAEAIGIRSVDPIGRALLLDASLGPPLARAAAAVRIAPDLPAAHVALARARWEAGEGPVAAGVALLGALAALARHVESRMWVEAAVSLALYGALLGVGMLWIAARGLRALPDAAHDLGDRLAPSVPGFAGAGVVAALVLAPAALGEGALGALLAPFALAWLYAEPPERRTLLLAAAAVALALGPLADAVGRRQDALAADPVALAVAASESGIVDAIDAARIERAAAYDPLAQLALARASRRAGALDRAEALLEPLLARDARDPVLLSEAALVALERGDAERAIELYRRALDLRPSAVLWFNLAQAHLRTIDMEGHEAALAAAQALDPATTRELTRRLSEGTGPGAGSMVVELPLGVARVRARLLAAADPAVADALRRPIAPGALGRTPWLAGAAFALLAALASLVGRGFETSASCRECGGRLCRRCRTGEPASALCPACARARTGARHGGPWEAHARNRSLRIAARRAGAALARVVPGLLEREPARPLPALAALAAAALAVAFAVGRHGALVDPASAGAAGPLALLSAAALCACGHVALSLWARAGGRRQP